MLVGHDQARAALERKLPAVTLLLGPAGTGKRVLADYLITYHQVHRSDTIRIWKLDAESARLVVHSANRVPPGSLKVIVIRLDGASEQAQNILLKALEEPPDPVRFILLAARPPLPTIFSRSQVYQSGLLTDAQVEQVLAQLGMENPGKYAPWGYGTVSGALEAAQKDGEDQQNVRSALTAALRAAGSRDWEVLTRTMRGWKEPHAAMLFRWSVEAGTGRWKEFTAEFAPGYTTDQALHLWRTLRARPHSVTLAAVALRKAVQEDR